MKTFKISSTEELEHLLSYNISKNHTGKWGCIQGRLSATYDFMHEDKDEVIKWISENWQERMQEYKRQTQN